MTEIKHTVPYKYCFTPTKCTIYVRIIKYSIKYLKPLRLFQLIDKPSSGAYRYAETRVGVLDIL